MRTGDCLVSQLSESLVQGLEDGVCIGSCEAEGRLDLEHVVIQTIVHYHDPILQHQPDSVRV